jgi:phosphoenolpyruvate---glycerone phosphotransferase subunit DhaL
MMNNFPNSRGMIVVEEMIRAIQENKQYLSDIDGLIGDGDHGINMNKGFTLCREELAKNPGDMTHALRTLSGVLMTKIGGSMGPLYGTLFEAMADASAGIETVDRGVFGRMLEAAVRAIGEISDARVGDKTLLDTLVPALEAFQAASTGGPGGFPEALDAMEAAAIKGRDSTKDLVAKKGRASRLGERSRGVPDAGAVSCCLILRAMAAGIRTLLC